MAHEKRVDQAQADGDLGLPVMAVRKDTPAALAPDGRYHPIAVDASGRLWVAIGGSVSVTGGLTDAELRASAVPVTGTFFQATQPVSGPLTDAELRATPVPVSGTVTTGFGATVATEQDTDGFDHQKVLAEGLVSDTPLALIDGEIHPVSLTSDGRVRVSVVSAPIDLDFFAVPLPNMTEKADLWAIASPWD